jgi:hypothetical protein
MTTNHDTTGPHTEPNQWQAKCKICGAHTSKRYARVNRGRCRWCAEGIPPTMSRLNWNKLTADQKEAATKAWHQPTDGAN